MPKSIFEILSYFMEEFWHNTHHPALTSLACKAVGGKPRAPDKISAAIVLLTGAADIHDDIIDKSKIKGAKPTAYGKFSQDLVLLAGDALLFKGITLLSDACNKFPEEKRQAIKSIVEEAFFEIGNAASEERALKANGNFQPEKYYKIIESKGAISEACARIGAIVGGGTAEEIETLGHFGRTLGFLMTLKSEFADLFEPSELRNRAKNEVLPLPLLYALEEKTAKEKIQKLLENGLPKERIREIVNLTLQTDKVQNLKVQMHATAKNEENRLKTIKKNNRAFKLLLRLSIEGI